MQLLQEVFANGGKLPLVVTGNSMRPFLRHGKDQVRLDSAVERKPRIGDIVLYQRENGGLILHRVVNIHEDRLQVLGDAQAVTETVWMQQVLAVVTDIVRGERVVACDGWKYRMCVRLWGMTRLVRPTLFRLYDGIRRHVRDGLGRTLPGKGEETDE